MLSRHIASMSSSVSSAIAREMPRPALLTHTSMRPKWSRAALHRCSTSLRFVTSVTTASASSALSWATLSSSAFLRAARTTLAPLAASCFASSAPMPALAPVMTTTLSMTHTTIERVAVARRGEGQLGSDHGKLDFTAGLHFQPRRRTLVQNDVRRRFRHADPVHDGLEPQVLDPHLGGRNSHADELRQLDVGRTGGWLDDHDARFRIGNFPLGQLAHDHAHGNPFICYAPADVDTVAVLLEPLNSLGNRNVDHVGHSGHVLGEHHADRGAEGNVIADRNRLPDDSSRMRVRAWLP